MIKFKIGDKPRIRSDLVSSEMYGSFRVAPDMLIYEGKVLVITEAFADGYGLEGNASFWTDKMFESVAVGEHRKPVIEVDRTAKIGDYISIVDADMTDGLYKNGDILLVSGIGSNGNDVFVMLPKHCHKLICREEYVVLQGYVPPVAEPEPPKPEPYTRKPCSSCKYVERSSSQDLNYPCYHCDSQNSNYELKPAPIMIGGMELRVGSKFILKPYDSISEHYSIRKEEWDEMFTKILTVKHPHCRSSIEVHSICGNSWMFNYSAIDRIIEVDE